MLRSAILLAVLLLAGCGSTPQTPGEEVPAALPSAADIRVKQWRSLINSEQQASEGRKLEAVNAFFNHLQFVDDIDLWGKEDYWATPLETIRSNGGDCEDIVIGKYFTLLELQVPSKRLRLTYVLAESVEQPHMVLSYYQSPDTEPLILDSLVRSIRTASQRPDLKPIYGFNSEGLWVTGSDNAALDDPTSQLSRWRNVLLRMEEEAQD
jgi:predicted transglutaminase-like cysteine proteinase